MVEAAGIGKVFGSGDGAVTALESVDLAIRQGEFVSLIGPSGCGKSTLLRIIGDLTRPTSGTLSINGKPAERARLDRDYGMVFQAPVLMDWRTIARNIELPLEIMGYPAEERRSAGGRSPATWSSSRPSPTGIRGSCRAGCSSASRSPGRSRSTRSSC